MLTVLYPNLLCDLVWKEEDKKLVSRHKHNGHSLGKSNPRASKPNLRDRSYELGLYPLRHPVIQTNGIRTFQEQLGRLLRLHYDGKSFTADSLAATVFGINELSDKLVSPRAKGLQLTSGIILRVLQENNLGQPAELQISGIRTFSKNPKARRQSVGLVCEQEVLRRERDAVNAVLVERQYPPLRTFGDECIGHICIGVIDTAYLSGEMRSDLSVILPKYLTVPEIVRCEQLQEIKPPEPSQGLQV